MDLENLKNNPEQIKGLIALLSSLLPDTNEEEDIVPKLNSNIKTNKSKAKGSSINLFDKMSEKISIKRTLK
jgi:hypothetical protein